MVTLSFVAWSQALKSFFLFLCMCTHLKRMKGGNFLEKQSVLGRYVTVGLWLLRVWCKPPNMQGHGSKLEIPEIHRILTFGEGGWG